MRFSLNLWNLVIFWRISKDFRKIFLELVTGFSRAFLHRVFSILIRHMIHSDTILYFTGYCFIFHISFIEYEASLFRARQYAYRTIPMIIVYWIRIVWMWRDHIKVEEQPMDTLQHTFSAEFNSIDFSSTFLVYFVFRLIQNLFENLRESLHFAFGPLIHDELCNKNFRFCS